MEIVAYYSVTSWQLNDTTYGVGAFTEGYRATGNEKYLQRAEYWARAGLPFLYAWTDPDRPLLPYASIPVFGATGFHLPWFGRPGQWNGVVYAYFLLDMLEVAGGALGDANTTAYPWRQIAEGVVISAMIQQRTTEPGKGGYPDVWELVENVPIKGVDINPEGLAKPAFMLMGHPVDVQTALLRRQSGVARVSSAARISRASWDDTGLTAQLAFHPDASSQLMVAGVPAPAEVAVDGRQLARVESLDADGVDEGWKISADGAVLVRLRHAAKSTLRLGF